MISKYDSSSLVNQRAVNWKSSPADLVSGSAYDVIKKFVSIHSWTWLEKDLCSLLGSLFPRWGGGEGGGVSSYKVKCQLVHPSSCTKCRHATIAEGWCHWDRRLGDLRLCQDIWCSTWSYCMRWQKHLVSQPCLWWLSMFQSHPVEWKDMLF